MVMPKIDRFNGSTDWIDLEFYPAGTDTRTDH